MKGRHRSRDEGRSRTSMRNRPRVAIPAFIQRGIDRAEKARKAREIARPMRAMFDLLKSGEVLEIDGHAVMRFPKMSRDEQTEWCAIAPAMHGWIDLWARIAKDISTYHMGVLADRLEQEKPITTRLVEQAREEFEVTIARIPELPEGRILSAITTTQIAWELEGRQG